MNDLISRQAAIEDVKSWVAVDGREKHLQKDVIEWLKKFPSAQSEIIYCRDCKYNTYSKKCLQPDSFFLVPADDFYCGYAERRTDE